MRESGDDPKARSRISMVMIPMLHGDKTNATSKLNSTSQTEVSTEREYSPGGIFSLKYRRLDND
jgi:hypothetical protein